MGTRADFYVGRGESAEWIGSITWDGHPDSIDARVFSAATEEDYRAAVTAFFTARDDVTYPSEPWPWPWENSQKTDYSYAFEDGKVYGSPFGHGWFEVDPSAEACGEPEDSDGPKVPLPDMSARKGDLGHIMRKSGMIMVSFPDTPGGAS